MSARLITVRVPTRKISETLLDFGAPLLGKFIEPVPIGTIRNAMLVVVTVWNSHVMEMPLWGAPEHRRELERLAHTREVPRQMREVLSALARRRREWFHDDPRAVGTWEFAPGGVNGYRFRCEAKLPSGVTPEH